MPLLDRESQRQLLGVTERQCDRCLQWIRRNYCRQCDEFFYECDCTRKQTTVTGHEGHRTY